MADDEPALASLDVMDSLIRFALEFNEGYFSEPEINPIGERCPPHSQSDFETISGRDFPHWPDKTTKRWPGNSAKSRGLLAIDSTTASSWMRCIFCTFGRPYGLQRECEIFAATDRTPKDVSVCVLIPFRHRTAPLVEVAGKQPASVLVASHSEKTTCNMTIGGGGNRTRAQFGHNRRPALWLRDLR